MIGCFDDAGRVPMAVIDEEGWIPGHGPSDRREGNVEMKAVNDIKAKRPAPLEVLKQVKFNTTQETPRSTIKGFLNLPNQADLKFTKDNLQKAEDQLKRAFVGFYQKLRLLKNYRYIYNF